MKPNDFVHLHVHSHYSALDGSITVPNLVKKARDYGMKALALTDHGTLSGLLEFYRTAHSGDDPIKPILGMEAYLAETSRLVKQIDGRPSRIYHLTLLARNNKGYKNLIKLSSGGHIDGFYRKPRIDLDLLADHSEGLIALSGCLSGRVARALLYEEDDSAERFCVRCREILGSENFFIEIMKNGLDEQEKANSRLIDLARRLDLPLVATNDVHYLEQADSLVQEVLVCIQRGQTLDDEKRQRMGTDQFYFRSGEEMIALFGDYPEAVENTALIAERCACELEFGEYHIPDFETDNGEPPSDMLERLCLKGLKDRYDALDADIMNRLESELSVINQMGFASYFLIVWDFIRFARENDIPVGPGRGSAAGSLVAYSLDITQLDPLRYDLLFERFLNSSRVSMPDIDIDFCIKGREKVVDYVREKYGHENVCQIVTFGTLAAKAALRDAGRVLDIDLPTVDMVAKKIPPMKPPGEKRSLLEVTREADPTLKEMYANEERIKKWFDISLKIEGLNRHPSTHAAGVVITDRPLTEYVPLCRVKDEINTQFQMGELEDIGLLKMDFLGLKNLTVIDKALDTIEKTTGERLDLDTLPLDDRNTYELLQSGKAKGIFQLESSEGMSNLLVKLGPDCFEDIIALLALYRPGPLGSGMVDLYVERKHGRQDVEMLHDMLSEILEETYGVIVYQEQVMRIANVLANFSLNDADMLRKAMGKKKRDVMLKFRKDFINGATANGVKSKDAGDIFDKIEYFADYGFNKSHSAAYALITYRTAYLKANYPLQYMSALMSCDTSNSDKIAESVEECDRMGIKVLIPDFNESMPDFSIAGESIRFGLNAIKGLGEKTSEAIVVARKAEGGFKSLAHMLEHVDLSTMNKLGLETLIKSGAFDSTEINRASYFDAVEKFLTTAVGLQRDRRNGQASLFGGGGSDDGLGTFTQTLDEWDETFKLACEKEALGFVLSSNPLKQYAPLLRRLAPYGPEDLAKYDEGAQTLLAGTLEQHRVTTVKKGRNAGKSISLFKIRTIGGFVSAVLFSEAKEKYDHLIQEDRVLFFTGTVDQSRDQANVKVSEIQTMDEALRGRWSAFLLRLGSADEIVPERIEEIREICRLHPGDFDLLLFFNGKGRRGYTIQAGNQFGIAPTLAALVELERVVGPDNVEIR